MKSPQTKPGLSELETSLGTKLFRKLYGVDGIIRVHNNEFRFIPSGRKSFYNFYAGTANLKEGSRYMVVKIVKRGVRLDDGSQILPRLSLSGHFFVKCTSLTKGIKIKDIPETFYSNSFTNITTEDELVKVLERRYKSSRPSLKKTDLRTYPITISLLEIESPEK